MPVHGVIRNANERLGEMASQARPLAAEETLPMYALSEELASTVETLGLRDNIRQLEVDGYTVIRGVSRDLTERIRRAVLRLVAETKNTSPDTDTAALLLGRDSVFADAVLHPAVLALAEYLCGRGALLSQLLGSVRGPGSRTLPLHCDQLWIPAPFPPHNTMMTACWVTDDFTADGGATVVVPGSHLRRRHPTAEEAAASEGAIPIECPPASIAVWDGAVWHANSPRLIEGERVVLHMTYTRLAYRPIEDYGHLDSGFLAQYPPAIATLLGREDFFGTTTVGSGFTDRAKLARTIATSRR